MPAPSRTDEASLLEQSLRTEAAAIERVAEAIAAGTLDHWTRAIDLLERCQGHVVVSGMGKSGLIGQKLSATFSSLGQPSHFVHPAEAVHGDLGRIRRGEAALLLSYGGETD